MQQMSSLGNAAQLQSCMCSHSRKQLPQRWKLLRPDQQMPPGLASRTFSLCSRPSRTQSCSNLSTLRRQNGHAAEPSDVSLPSHPTPSASHPSCGLTRQKAVRRRPALYLLFALLPTYAVCGSMAAKMSVLCISLPDHSH